MFPDPCCSFFDTAEAYGGGESERVLGAALKASGVKRSDVVIASKVLNNHLKYDEVKAACEGSLKNLGDFAEGCIDLYQVHWPNHDVPAEETFRALKELKDEGKIKAVGVSNYGPKDLEAAVKSGVPIVTNQLPYSLLWRAIEHEVKPACEKAEGGAVGIMAYSPLQQGLLSGKYTKTSECNPGLSRSRLFGKDVSPKCRHTEPGCEEELWKAVADIRAICEKAGRPMPEVALAWALQRPGVVSVLFGASKASHVGSNVKAALTPLDDETMKALTEATEGLKAKVGKNCDLWDDTDGGRYR